MRRQIGIVAGTFLLGSGWRRAVCGLVPRPERVMGEGRAIIVGYARSLTLNARAGGNQAVTRDSDDPGSCGWPAHSTEFCGTSQSGHET